MTRPDLDAARREAEEALSIIFGDHNAYETARKLESALRSLLAATANLPEIPESSPAPEGCGICLPGLCTCPSYAPAPASPPAGASEALDCPDCSDCSVQETATGWTLRRCNRHRIDVRFVSVPSASGAGGGR